MSVEKHLHLVQDILQGKLKTKYFCGPQKWQFSSCDRVQISENLRPFANDYFHPLNPAFLYEFSSLEAMLSFPVICARDGVVTLFDFFWEHPTPLENGPLLLVAHELYPLVPPAWQSQVLPYRVGPKLAEKGGQKKILFYGLAQDSYTSVPHLKKILPLIPRGAEVHALFFVEDDPFFDPPHEIIDAAFPFIQEIALTLQTPVHFRTYSDFLEEKNLADFSFLDLQEKNFSLSDNTLTHYLYSRGAHNLTEPSSTSTPLVKIPLSPFHELQLLPPHPNKNLSSLFSMISKVRQSPLIEDPGQKDYFCALKELASLL